MKKTTMGFALLSSAFASSLALAQDKPSELFDWVGIIGTGQSLSVGAWFLGPINEGPSYNNLKLFDPSGSYSEVTPDLKTLPLTEPLRSFGEYGTYPKNILGASHHHSMADVITRLSMKFKNKDYVTAHTEVGLSGTGYEGIKKGGNGNSYNPALFEAKAFSELAKAQGKRYGVGAILLTHGENDWKNPLYKEQMAQMQADYDQDLKAITGQSNTIPLFTSQQHAYPCAINLPDGVAQKDYSTQKQWHVGNDYPGRVYTVGPKYQYEYRDTIHLTVAGYDAFGEKAGEVYYRTMELGEDWHPLKPVTIKRMGEHSLRVNFYVPNPPLRWDEKMEAPHQTANQEWKEGKGFEVMKADGSKIVIKAVTIASEINAVDIEIEGNATDAMRVQYAMTMDGKIVAGTNDWGCYGGSPLGQRGLLMDSDDLINQANYSVSFSKAVEN
ncbi:MAG: dockerin [Proteobacteria bacterium]|nr:MAG: dockerin [Pseudomonadota bacterium]